MAEGLCAIALAKTRSRDFQKIEANVFQTTRLSNLEKIHNNTVSYHPNFFVAACLFQFSSIGESREAKLWQLTPFVLKRCFSVVSTCGILFSLQLGWNITNEQQPFANGATPYARGLTCLSVGTASF